jgi:hypothetical protein
VAVTCHVFGQRPSRWMRLHEINDALSDEFDREMCGLYLEFEDARELNRLKRFWNWAWGGEKEGGKTSCQHERFKKLPDGTLKCLDCGEVGN